MLHLRLMPNTNFATMISFIFALLSCMSFADESYSDLPFLVTLPPADMQLGGTDIKKALGPSYPGQAPSEAQRYFVGQTLNLALIGPGTNLIFVSDMSGKFTGFAFSNGRFENEKDNGRLDKKTFPLSSNLRLGKYPWPRDAQGKYLDGDMLVTSNGPHSSLKRILSRQAGQLKADGSKPVLPFVAGHVGVDANGKVYIGYISASVNGPLKRNKDYVSEKEKPFYKEDGRSLPASLRAALHLGARNTFYGRNLNEVLDNAPETTKAMHEWGALRFFPPTRYIPAFHQMLQRPLEYLVQTLGLEGTLRYISQASSKVVFQMLMPFTMQQIDRIPLEQRRAIQDALEKRFKKLHQGQTDSKSERYNRYELKKLSKEPVLETAFRFYLLQSTTNQMLELFQCCLATPEKIALYQDVLIQKLASTDQRLLITIGKRVVVKEWFGEEFRPLAETFLASIEFSIWPSIFPMFGSFGNEWTARFFRPSVQEFLENAEFNDIKRIVPKLAHSKWGLEIYGNDLLKLLERGQFSISLEVLRSFLKHPEFFSDHVRTLQNSLKELRQQADRDPAKAKDFYKAFQFQRYRLKAFPEILELVRRPEKDKIRVRRRKSPGLSRANSGTGKCSTGVGT